MAERGALKNEGYSDEQINAPENLVRIPRLKHHEITGWYQTPNKKYGGLTPRQYLVGKPFDEKLRVKREALILFKVLKP